MTGLSAALYLQLNGWAVTCLDAGAEGVRVVLARL
ncbi:MAG: hypothetical protein M3P70_07635 [Actinomycetota bacterium]|nr:hypothetical protein [Actinomycetota bacterium]